MKTIDTCGLFCPKPLIMVKEAMRQMNPGDSLRILTDNETSSKNLITYLNDQDISPGVSKEGNVYTIISEVPVKNMSESDPERYCNTNGSSKDYVVCIKQSIMGDKDPELGSILMESFINHLNQQEQLPSHIIFYNEGVLLAKKSSPVIDTLIELENTGIRIMVCGTCINHFRIQKEIGVGMISNMVVITEVLANAGHVIYP